MKNIIFILTITVLFSCVGKNSPDKSNHFYYIINNDNQDNGDTIKYEEFKSIGAGDELVSQGHFKYNKKEHIIKMYSSDNHAPVDGGRLYYTLDSIGTIYSKSTTWFSSISLQTNNDSINNLINNAYAYILLKQNLHCYHCRLVDTTNVTFLPPVIKEE